MPGALHPGGVHHHVDERLSGGRVDVQQHLRGDLDQERVEFSGIPVGEDVGDLRRLQPGTAAQQVVGLGDQLHVGVLDAVVDHLDEVTGTVLADVGAAWRAVDMGGDLLQDRAERLVGQCGTARHDRRPVQRAFLAAGDAAADEVDALDLRGRLPPDGVLELGVAAVDQDVAGLQQLGELVDDRIGRAAGLDHDDDLAGHLEGRHELRRRLRPDELTV